MMNQVQNKMQLVTSKKPKHIVFNSPNSAFTNAMNVNLLDGLGKVVNKSLNFTLLDDYTCEVDFTTMPLGVYHVQIVDEQLFFVKRIILGETPNS